MLSNRPGETFDPVTATRTGWNAWRGFRPSPSAVARSAASIASASNGSSEASASSVAASIGPPPSSSAACGSTSRKKKPAKPGNSDELGDLLLHDRRDARHQLGIPLVAVLAEPEEKPVCEVVERERAQVDAV